MPLAEYKGGLIVKVEIDEYGNEVRKLCTTCCGDEPGTGRCCVYTGEILDMACGETRQECEDDARRIAATDPNSFWSADNITQDTQPDADCPYSVFVYTYIPEADTPVCWDEDEDGNPVTKDFCDALKTPDVFKAEFTAGANCESDNSGSGPCPPATRSNPLP